MRAGNKLTNEHVQFKNSKMKVSLAAQLMSSSVAHTLSLAVDLHMSGFDVYCLPTVKFIEVLQKISLMFSRLLLTRKFH